MDEICPVFKVYGLWISLSIAAWIPLLRSDLVFAR